MEDAEPIEPAMRTPGGSRRGHIILRIAMLLVAAAVLYGFMPELVDMFEQLPELGNVRPRWFLIMLGLEFLSFACMWQLWRLAIPGLSWGTAASSQLSANTVSRVVPGGAAVGAAAGFRMLATNGVDKGRAAAALGANSLISNVVLAALPVIAVGWSVIGTRIPERLEPGAWAGVALFVVLVTAGFVLVRYDRPPRALGDLLHRVVAPVYRRLGREPVPDGASFVAARDRLVVDLGPRWKAAIAAAAGNWLFDYLALVLAVDAVGGQPKPGLILLAYTGAALLAMIPITPGGLGFVEAGLTSMLIAAHIRPERALLATLAYRLVSFWAPLVAGLVAYLLFRWRHRHHGAPALVDAESLRATRA